MHLRSDGFDRFRAIQTAFDRADYTTVRTLLAIAEPAGADPRTELIRARLARLEDDVPAWLAAARRASDGRGGDLVARTLLALAAKRTGGPTELAALEREALAAPPATAGYAVYLLALEAYFERAFERTEALLARNLAHGVEVAPSLALRAWIAFRRERFDEAAVGFEAALEALDRSHATDAQLRVRTVLALARIAVCRLDVPLGERVRAAYAAIAWTPGLAVEHGALLAELRDLAVIDGDVDEAWLLARRATTLHASGPWAVAAETGAAYVAALVKDRHALEVQLQRAWRLIETADWCAATFEAREALVFFAVVASIRLPAEAKRALALYDELAARPSDLEDFTDDRRAATLRLGAFARLAEVTETASKTIERYEDVLAAWLDLGHRLFAARAATQLLAMTGDERYRQPIDAALARAPKVRLEHALRAGDNPLVLLSPSERRVLDQLLLGKSAKAIGAVLGRSPHTIANHTRRVFAVFDVTSRGKLLARCNELGVVAPQSSASVTPRSANRPARTIA